MRAKSFNQKGFEAVMVGVVLLFVAVVGFAGFKVMSMNKSAETASVVPATQVAAPATIKTKADLVKTDQALEASALETDKGLNSKALDADLETLL